MCVVWLPSVPASPWTSSQHSLIFFWGRMAKAFCPRAHQQRLEFQRPTLNFFGQHSALCVHCLANAFTVGPSFNLALPPFSAVEAVHIRVGTVFCLRLALLCLCCYPAIITPLCCILSSRRDLKHQVNPGVLEERGPQTPHRASLIPFA